MYFRVPWWQVSPVHTFCSGSILIQPKDRLTFCRLINPKSCITLNYFRRTNSSKSKPINISADQARTKFATKVDLIAHFIRTDQRSEYKYKLYITGDQWAACTRVKVVSHSSVSTPAKAANQRPPTARVPPGDYRLTQRVTARGRDRRHHRHQ